MKIRIMGWIETNPRKHAFEMHQSHKTLRVTAQVENGHYAEKVKTFVLEQVIRDGDDNHNLKEHMIRELLCRIIKDLGSDIEEVIVL